MASRRMVSWKISTDLKVRELPYLGAKLLFTWMIAHADNCGRLRGEPAYVRALVMPNEDVTDEDVGRWITAMAQVGLVNWYEQDGCRYVALVGWGDPASPIHQRLDRQTQSDIPAPADCTPVVTGPSIHVQATGGDRR